MTFSYRNYVLSRLTTEWQTEAEIAKKVGGNPKSIKIELNHLRHCGAIVCSIDVSGIDWVYKYAIPEVGDKLIGKTHLGAMFGG